MHTHSEAAGSLLSVLGYKMSYTSPQATGNVILMCKVYPSLYYQPGRFYPIRIFRPPSLQAW